MFCLKNPEIAKILRVKWTLKNLNQKQLLENKKGFKFNDH